MKFNPEINMKRIFIAVKIDPGDTLIRMISSLRSGLKNEKIKWSDPENFHITLAFLGDTENNKIKEINKMLKLACEGFGEFEIIIKGLGVFKNLNDPRVIWTGIEPSDKLNTLQESVRIGLKETDIIPEDRPFKPHLTLGRIKSIQDNDVLKTLIDGYKNMELQKQEINAVILYESILSRNGAVYKALTKFPLR